MPRIAIILENSPGCVLSRTELEVEEIDSDTCSEMIGYTIDTLILSVGDTIKIVEIQP